MGEPPTSAPTPGRTALPNLWPPGMVSEADCALLWERLRAPFLARLGAHRIDPDAAEGLAAVYLPLAAWIAGQRGNAPLVVGINGAQGSGKSTLCDFLAWILEEAHGCRVAVFSIDDLYKTRAERERLAREVHPLLVTRGVPGTHDVALGRATLDALRSAEPHTMTPLPRFDKARDEPAPRAHWPRFQGRPDVVLFEGWCVGTPPQREDALREPVNALERDEDPDGRWRRYVNQRLAEDYAELFRELDRLVLLQVPALASVFEWRTLQERKLAEAGPRYQAMEAAALRRFVLHYERLTLHNLDQLPGRADLVLYLDPQHRFTRVEARR